LKRSERDAYGAALKIQRSFEKSAEKIKKAYYDMWAGAFVQRQAANSRKSPDSLIAEAVAASKAAVLLERQAAASKKSPEASIAEAVAASQLSRQRAVSSFGPDWDNRAQTNAIKQQMAANFALGKSFNVLNGAIAGIGVWQLWEGFKSAALSANDLSKAAEDLQISLSQLSKFTTEGGKIEDLEKLFNKIQESASKSEEPFDALGVKIKDASGKMREMNAIIEDLSAAMGGNTSFAEKFGVAVETVGVKRASEFVSAMKKASAETSTFNELANNGTRVLSFFGEMIKEAPKYAAGIGKAVLGMLPGSGTISELVEFGEEVDSIKAKQENAAKERIRELEEENALIYELAALEEEAAERVAEINKEIARIKENSARKAMSDAQLMVALQGELFDILERQTETEEDAAKVRLDAAKKEAEIEDLAKKIGPDAALAAPLSQQSQSANQLQRIGAQVGGVPRTETLLKENNKFLKNIERNTARNQGEVIP
jgi:chromosome segregation ATPase